MKRRLIAAAILLVALAVAWSALQLSPPSLRAGRPWPVLGDVTVVNPGDVRRAHQTVTIRDGMIESIRDVEPDAPPRPRDRLYAGRYVLPGLIDMDVRCLPTAESVLGLAGVRFLAGGTTTVRVIDKPPGDALRNAIERGDLPWPRLVEEAGGQRGSASLRLIELVTPAPPTPSAADHLRRWAALTPAEVDALAGRLGGAAVTTNLARWTWLACPNDPVIPSAAALGVFQPRFVREVEWPAQRTAGCTTTAGETLSAERRAAAAARMADAARTLHRAGVVLLPGSGAPSPQAGDGYGLWLELASLVQLGLSAEQAWRAATRDAGAALGIPGLGTIAPGAPADLLVFRDDPTSDLGALRSLEAVVTKGRIYPAYKLTRYSLEYARYFQHPIYDRVSMTLARVSGWWNGESAAACEPL